MSGRAATIRLSTILIWGKVSQLTDVIHGRCRDGTFYIYAWHQLSAGLLDIYGYTSELDGSCHPLGWVINTRNDFGGGWFSATVTLIDETPFFH